MVVDRHTVDGLHLVDEGPRHFLVAEVVVVEKVTASILHDL
jgi:hypothetical protein